MIDLQQRTDWVGGSDISVGQIPRESWEQFLNDFTKLNRETAVRIEEMEVEGLGPQVLVDSRPLLSVTLDDEAGTPQVIIECGDTGGASPAAMKHIANNPTRIWAHESCPGCVDAIKIETRGSGAVVLSVNPHPGR